MKVIECDPCGQKLFQVYFINDLWTAMPCRLSNAFIQIIFIFYQKAVYWIIMIDK